MNINKRVGMLCAFIWTGLTLAGHGAVVPVSGGGEGVLSAAIGNAAPGDIIEIQDSLVYSETHAIQSQWKAGMTLCAKTGQMPVINMEQKEAWGGLAPAADGVQIGTNEGGPLIMRSRQDGIYCITSNTMPNGATLRIEHCVFTGADANGQNQWKGGGLITNNATNSTTIVDNCDFFDIASGSNNPFAVYSCPAANTGATLNIKNCRFGASIEGGACQYIYNPNAGCTVNVDGTTFKYGGRHITISAGTVNATHSTFEKAGEWSIFIHPNSPTVNLSYCAFWNCCSSSFIYLTEEPSAAPILNVDHCDFAGDIGLQPGAKLWSDGNSRACTQVTNCMVNEIALLSMGAAQADTVNRNSNVYDFEVDPTWHMVTLYNSPPTGGVWPGDGMMIPGKERFSGLPLPALVSVHLSGDAAIGGLRLNPLKAYYVYDISSECLVGRMNGSACLQEVLQPGEIRLFSIREAQDHPQFLSLKHAINQRGAPSI